MIDNTKFFKSEFGYVFTYGGYDKAGRKHTAYRVLAKTPEDLFYAMQSWHTYGSQNLPALVPSARFQHIINAIFSIDDGSWIDIVRSTGCKERVWCGDDNTIVVNGYDIPTRDIKTSGCGAWGVNCYKALAPTLEEHEDKYREQCEREKQYRLRKANEQAERRYAEYCRHDPAKWVLYITSPYDVCCQLSFWTIADSQKDAFEKLQQEIQSAFSRSRNGIPNWQSFTFEKYEIRTIDDIERDEEECRGKFIELAVQTVMDEARNSISWCNPADEKDADGRYWLSAYNGAGSYRLIISDGKIVGSIVGGFHGSNNGKVTVASWAEALIRAAKERYPMCHLIKANGSGTYFYLCYDEHKSLISNVKEYYVPTYGSPLLTKNMEIH